MLNRNLLSHLSRQLFSPGQAFRKRYESFRSLLEHDKKAHELMAELEEYYYRRARVDLARVERQYRELAFHVKAMIQDLAVIDPLHHTGLEDYFKKLDAFARFIFKPPDMSSAPPYVVPLGDLPPDSEALAGGKAFNLGVIASLLNLPIPNGLVITTNAYNLFMEANSLRELVDGRLAELDINDPGSLDEVSGELQQAVSEAEVPQELAEAIQKAFDEAWPSSGQPPSLAMRSSAAAEDSETSFAGQYRSILNLSPKQAIGAYREILASKYSPQAISYRVSCGLSDLETPMAVIALEMVNAMVSGVIYTHDPGQAGNGQMGIHSVWGLGEILVSGHAWPDVTRLSKDDPPAILEKLKGGQDKLLTAPRGQGVVEGELDPEQKTAFSLTDGAALNLADWALRLEEHYQTPQDIEWCQDHDGNLFILQSRPLNLPVQGFDNIACDFSEFENHILLHGGHAASSGAGAGAVYKPQGEDGLGQTPWGAVLVTRHAPPHYATVMGRLSGLITETGSPASHLASVAREFGVPMLVNVKDADKKLDSGDEVTIYACGLNVYQGRHQEIVDHDCLKKDPVENSPLQRKLRYMVSFISPLSLTDPEAENFSPQGTRSLHDILRFCHENAVRSMFTIGEKRLRKTGGAKKLISGLPMLFYVLDVGGGLSQGSASLKQVSHENIISLPMLALLKGLKHPGITWGGFTHFNWEEYDRIVMAGGIISAESAMLASYAVISHDYLNLNLRFGYHFVILDTLCSKDPRTNHIRFRFAGGGAELEKRSLRADFLQGVLRRLGFEVSQKSDLVDAYLSGESSPAIEKSLDMLGRLLGATKLMDMYIRDQDSITKLVDEFMEGRYDFARVSLK